MLPLYHWNVRSFGLTNTEPAIYFHFVWGKRTWSHDFGTIRLERMNVLFIISSSKFYSLRLPTLSMFAVTGHSAWLWVQDWWGTFYANSQRCNSSETLVISNSDHSWRHDQTWPKLDNTHLRYLKSWGSIRLAKLDIQNNLLWMLCSILESGRIWRFVLHLQKSPASTANIFLMNFNRENLVEMPQVGARISGRASEAPGPCCPWRPPRRLSRAGTLQPRCGRNSPRSGAAFGLRGFSRGWWAAVASADEGAEADAPRRRRKLWAAELHTRSTDKRTKLVFDSTSYSNCSKQSTNTLNKFQYIFLTNDMVFDKTLCNNLCVK